MSAMTSIDGGRTLRGGVLLAAVVAAGLAGAALQGERGGGEGDALAPAPATPVASGAPVAQGSPAVAAERPIGRTARSARRDVVAAASRVDPDIARRAEVGAALEELERLHGYAGELGWDEAKALVERRRQATDDLVLRLARLGRGGARAISSAYARAGGVRARLVLIQALAKVGDDEAAPTLASLLARERAFSLRSEMLRALGARSEADGAARDALVAVLASDGDPRLRFAAVQALSGREEALPALLDRVLHDASVDVRKEAIRAIGLIASEAARSALAGIAEGPADEALRAQATRELARSFGEGVSGARRAATEPR